MKKVLENGDFRTKKYKFNSADENSLEVSAFWGS